jgi:exonuclease III
MIKSLAKKKGGICILEPESLAFTQMIDNLKLIDLEPTNGCFTWNNKRGGKNQIASRLDHFLITEHALLEG